MIFRKPKLYWSMEEAECNPTKVRRLFLKDVEIHALGNRIAQFARLEFLEFGWCSDTTLPREILQLKRLKSFNILNTPLELFPDWLSALPRLEELMLRGTDIREIPSTIRFFSHLRSINFGNNWIDSIPPEVGELKQLRSLHLPDTYLSSIPDEILNLPKLKSIGLYNTRFSEVEANRVRSKFPRTTICPIIC